MFSVLKELRFGLNRKFNEKNSSEDYSIDFFNSKESATLANRLIEGQVSNAQYAEESYQLKRENNSLRKQLEEFLTKSSGEIIQSNENELKMLRESVEKLNEVRFLIEKKNKRKTFFFSS